MASVHGCVCLADASFEQIFLMSRITHNAPLSPARVGEVPPDAPLEEALAAFACEHAVVFAAGLVAAHHTVHHAGLVVVSGLHVAAPRLWGTVLLVAPQVALVSQTVGSAIGISPAPAHHGHRLVTEPLRRKI